MLPSCVFRILPAFFVLMILSWSGTAFGQACSMVCPAAVDCMTECEIAPGEPEFCETWCDQFGVCSNCPTPTCPDECAFVCTQAGSQCDTPCTRWDGAMCNPGTCGDAGYTPPDCSNQGGYIPSGGPYDCCNGGDTCTCQEYDEAIYECVSTACVPELTSPTSIAQAARRVTTGTFVPATLARPVRASTPTMTIRGPATPVLRARKAWVFVLPVLNAVEAESWGLVWTRSCHQPSFVVVGTKTATGC